MKRLLLSLVLLCGCASAQILDPIISGPKPAAGGGGTPTLEKSCTINNDAAQAGATSCSWAGGGSSTAGDLVGCSVFTSQGGVVNNRTYAVATSAAESMTNDSPSGTWWVIRTDGHSMLFSKPNAAAATGVTVTPSGTDYFGAVCYAFSGMATTTPFDISGTVHDNGFDNGAPWTANATGTLSQASELVLASVQDDFGSTVAFAGTGLTQIGTAVGGFNAGTMALFYKVVSSTAPVTPAGTITTPGTNYQIYAFAATYKGL